MFSGRTACSTRLGANLQKFSNVLQDLGKTDKATYITMDSRKKLEKTIPNTQKIDGKLSQFK
ncbi:hypothetical protein FACHB389_01615 [Nostoc calcicola FACHB-389]|nr:hypothetical protein FACHB389_01615 [Nostoc calcicola FACHB-389]